MDYNDASGAVWMGICVEGPRVAHRVCPMPVLTGERSLNYS
jgi:hypothetical protein